MGLLGIAIAFGLLTYLVFIGMSSYYVAPLCAVVVALFNGISPLTAFTNSYLTGLGGFLPNMFGYILLGGILGKILEDSGAARSIGETCLRVFTRENDSPKKKLVVAVLLTDAVALLLSYGGVNAVVVLLATLPVALSVLKSCDIPRRFAPAMIMGASGAALAGPGAPQSPQFIASNILGTSGSCGLIPGLVGMVVILVGSVLYLLSAISKAQASGEHYVMSTEDEQMMAERKMPNFIFSFAPLLLVFCLYNFAKVDAVLALFIGIIVALVLCGKYIPNAGLPAIIKSFNAGASSAGIAILNIGSLVGFATVVQSTEAFNWCIEKLLNFPGPPLVSATLAMVVIVALTNSSVAGLQFGLPTFNQMFVQTGLVSAAALHRMGTFSGVIFETLPTNGAVCSVLSLTRLSHKEAYWPIFVVSIIMTGLGTIVALALFLLFPGII